MGRNVNVVLLAAPSARDEVSVGNVLDYKCFPVDEASPISRKNPTEEADRIRNKNPSFGRADARMLYRCDRLYSSL
jgi:hypothetical protein